MTFRFRLHWLSLTESQGRRCEVLDIGIYRVGALVGCLSLMARIFAALFLYMEKLGCIRFLEFLRTFIYYIVNLRHSSTGEERLNLLHSHLLLVLLRGLVLSRGSGRLVRTLRTAVNGLRSLLMVLDLMLHGYFSTKLS